MRNKDFYISKNEKIMQSLIDKHDAGDGKKNFVKDGIVNPEVWFSLSPEKEKILFLLKESYEKDKNIKRISDLTKWICKEKCTEIVVDTVKITAEIILRELANDAKLTRS